MHKPALALHVWTENHEILKDLFIHSLGKKINKKNSHTIINFIYLIVKFVEPPPE
jgi:hypothetical protein